MNLDPLWPEFEKVLNQCSVDCVDYISASALSTSPGFERSRYSPNSEPPSGETELAVIYSELKSALFDNPQYLNSHPGFFGWSLGPANADSMLAELLKAAINSSVQSGAQTLTRIELEVIEWMKSILDWPKHGTGLFVGGSAAGNLMALMVARNNLNETIKEDGVWPIASSALTWGSTETHLTISRALNVIGLGTKSFRPISTNADGSLNIDELQRQLANSPRARNLCVVANLGTTSTGAFDDVAKIADFCKEHRIWLHVDAAWGAWLKLDPSRRHLVQGLERADSITIDFHKWPGAPMGTGLTLFRPGIDLKSAFAIENPYLATISNDTHFFGDMGLELSRPARALAPWIILRHHGFKKIGQLIGERCDLAKYLDAELQKLDGVRVVFPVTSTVVVVDFDEPGKTETTARQLWLENRFMPSLLKKDDHYQMRFNILNHRTTKADIDSLIEKLAMVAKQ